MKKTAVILMLTMIALAVPVMADDAAAIFKTKCQACHGPDGAKLAKANLTATTKSEAEIATFLTTNGAHKTKVADETQAKALATFVKSLRK